LHYQRWRIGRAPLRCVGDQSRTGTRLAGTPVIGVRRERSRVRRVLADHHVGVLGSLGLLCPAFVAVFVIAGASRPGYSAVRDEVSDLAWGSAGWLQTTSFVVFGVLLVLFALGLAGGFVQDRAALRGGVALALSGAGLVALAIFPADYSYRKTTLHGVVHGSLFCAIVLSFVASLWWFQRAFARHPQWRSYTRFTQLTGILAPGVWAVLLAWCARGAGDMTEPLSAVTGLVQRSLIMLLCVWIVVVAQRHARLWRAHRFAAAAQPLAVRADR
jgi:hypothetical membrane protein